MTTGDVLDTEDALHTFSAASKESLHINMLTLAIHGNHHARTFVSPNEPLKATERAISILTTKIRSYNQFNENVMSLQLYQFIYFSFLDMVAFSRGLPFMMTPFQRALKIVSTQCNQLGIGKTESLHWIMVFYFFFSIG